jgi:hypothetical protein
MFGQYEHFPKTIHVGSRFATQVPTKTIQENLIRALHTINSESFKLQDITYPMIPNCTAIFELGIADGEGFNYLTTEETDKSIRAIHKTPPQTLDFFLDIRYYRDPKERKTALRFDYYMLRFVFDAQQMEIQISHEKGPRRVTPDDLITFIAEKINHTSPKKMLETLE